MDLKKAIKHQELKDLMVKKLTNGNHELVLDIGLQALKISEDWQIYRDMGCSSLRLKKYKDAINFFKQQSKLVAKIKDADWGVWKKHSRQSSQSRHSREKFVLNF